ncbi:hypothetical protein BDA96_08G116400 [Sorghum bicolor]|uniref:DUF4220 domain-containing protein n=1 Tax=Sorghum bicolor TaxID=4558 RepID=A0A921QFL2_SORBI|nr:hypothetical protein BDA96_08G116400 [Sorghum bicolor]
MRALRELEDVGVHQSTQRSSVVSRAQQFINERELQCMVMASFSLQVLLFFLSGFRKRYSSRALSVVLWLAYLSADSLAVYILGRLTLRGGGGGNRFALFWVPFLLLHLGGQETMTAFSMEDNALWKRHLLSLATQVPMAIYAVGKQLQGDDVDRRLVAPMVLVFVSGTPKYAERIWALRRAGSVAPGTGASNSSSSNLVARASSDAFWNTQAYYSQLCIVVSEKQERNSELILHVAAEGFKLSLYFLMDMTPSICLFPADIDGIKQAVNVFKSSENIVHMAYKLAEINLSLIYDYLYTKFGTRHFHMVPFCIAFRQILALVLISGALGLFATAIAGGPNPNGLDDDGADVIICYVLLVGAIILETCSIFMSFIFSSWAYNTTFSLPLNCPMCQSFPGTVAAMVRIARNLHPESRGEWSASMAQYSIIRDCIKEKQESGLLRRTMRWVGIDQRAVNHVGVSPVMKKLVLGKLLEIAATPRVQEWDIGVGKFSGQWANWAVEAMQDRHQQSAARQVLQVSNIKGLEFVSSALLWHIVTDISLLAVAAHDDVDDVHSVNSIQDPEEHLQGVSSLHENGNVGGSSDHGGSPQHDHENGDGNSIQEVRSDHGGSPQQDHENGDGNSIQEVRSDHGGSPQHDHENGDGNSIQEVHLDGSSSHHDHENANVDGGDSSFCHGKDEDDDGSISALRGAARELSDYIMYLVADCGAMAGSEGHYAVIKGKREMSNWLLEQTTTTTTGAACDRRTVLEEIRDKPSSFFHEDYYPVLDRARRVASDLLRIAEAGERWKLIAAVWLEMLCYIAYNCGAAFHAKHLTTGGEFVTHVKMILFMLGVPFLRDVKEPLLSKAGDIYS